MRKSEHVNLLPAQPDDLAFLDLRHPALMVRCRTEQLSGHEMTPTGIQNQQSQNNHHSTSKACGENCGEPTTKASKGLCLLAMLAETESA